MSTEEDKAIVRRGIEQFANQGNFAAIDELVDRDYVFHAPGLPELRGHEGFTQMVMLQRTAFPDLHFTIEDMIAEGETVVTRFTARGTHRGELMGIPPTGKQASFPGILISRITNGKIVEEWEISDDLGMLQQLGVVPPPGQAGA
jgi:steroid delta-isomerase-like uncharacterized protein